MLSLHTLPLLSLPYILQMVLLFMYLILVMSRHQPCLFPIFIRFPNSHIIFYLLGNSLNLVFLLHFLILVWLRRILKRYRSLRQPVRSKGCLISFFHLSSSRLSTSTVSGQSTSSLDLWHSLISHASISRVKQLVSRGLLGFVSNKSFDYMPCQFGKLTALPFKHSVSHALSSFDLIDFNV